MNDHSHSHQIRVPRGALIAAGLLIGFTIVAVMTFRITGQTPAAQIPVADVPTETRTLRFEDSAEGTVVVYELAENDSEQIVHVVPSGEGGFIRGVLRSMARARNASDIGNEHPFRLIEQTNGTLVLEDPQTGQRIDLQAFGPTNIESFRAMLNREASS